MPSADVGEDEVCCVGTHLRTSGDGFENEVSQVLCVPYEDVKQTVHLACEVEEGRDLGHRDNLVHEALYFGAGLITHLNRDHGPQAYAQLVRVDVCVDATQDATLP